MQEDIGLQIQLSHPEEQLNFGDTCTAQGIKLVNMLYKNKVVSVPFTSYQQKWETLKRRFMTNYRPQQPINVQFFVQLLSNKTIISSLAPLETYKVEICDKKSIYFRIYAMESQLAEELVKQLNSEIAQKQSMINPRRHNETNIISIIVNKPKSQQSVIRINRYSPLQLLKLEVSKMEKLDPLEFSLMFMGKKLNNDNQTLDDRGIDDESQVDLIMLVKKGCFSNDTEVLVPEGFKKAGEIKVGDYVISKGQNGLEKDEVTSIHKTTISEYIQVELEGRVILKCSQNHKFSSSKGWLSFQYYPGKMRLQVGDSIYCIDSKPIKIISITHMKTEASQFLHFSTLKNHNYFINGLLCHNMELRVISNNDGKQYMINVSDTDTIKIIKLRLEQPTGFSSDQMQIVLNKHELKDNESISDYLHDYKNLNHLQLLQKVDKNVIIICRIKERRQYRFDFDKKQTVRDLKEKISTLLGVSSQMLILILNNTQMLNKQEIGEFHLEKNFNRINLIEVQEDIISTSKLRFERKKILNVRIKQNSYLRLNFFPLKQMKVEHFLLSFLPDSTPVNALLFGTTILGPSNLLKEIEDLQIFNEEEINCFIVNCYDKLAFKKGLDYSLPFNPLQIVLRGQQQQQLQARKAYIETQLKKAEYFHPMMQQFKQKIQDFYTPLQYFTTKEAKTLLDSYLNQFYRTIQGRASQIKGHQFCSSFIHSLQSIAAHVGQVNYLLKDIRFQGIYNRGNSFYLQSFLSTTIAPVSHNTLNSTVLHIKSLTGRNIGLFTNKNDQILFRPFTYFYLNRLVNHETFDEAWLIQVPSPQSFEKDILLWVDDEPHSKENKQIRFLIDENRYELVQLVSTEIAQFWMKEFGWLLKWKGRSIKVMSDMRRIEGNPPIAKQEAGLDLIDLFHNTFGYTIPIFIFCSNLRKAKEALKNRKTDPSRIQKITIDQFDLITYLTS